MMWLRRVILGLPIFLAAFFAVAFVAVRVSAPRKLNQFVEGTIGEPETLNPLLSTTTAAAAVEGRVFNGLVRRDENLELEGSLAHAWDIRQSTRLFFASEREAATALGRIVAHKDAWADWSLRQAQAQANALQLDFDGAGTSYRGALFAWLGDLKPLPVAFVGVQLDTDKKFPDGKPVNSQGAIERIDAALAATPQLGRRTIYKWTGGLSSYLEMPVYGDVKPIVKVINRLLRASEGEEALGQCVPEDPGPSIDEPQITFRLRKDVKWHDGKPFTSADVVFTYESLMSEQVASPRRSDYELIREVSAPDAHTVRVVYKKPYAPALVSWSMHIIPKHILAGKSTEWWARNFNRQPIGTGPFVFDTWNTNEAIALRRNPDYWEGSPHVERVVIRFIPDQLALRLSFETQEVDIHSPQPHALGTMAKNPDYDIFSRLSAGYTYVGWNLERPLFRDRRVRHALAHAVDVDRIIKYVLYSQGSRSLGIFPPQMWFANPDIQPLAYDLERSRELLAEAGWKERDDGGWLVKDGKRFEFTLITNQANPTRKDITALVQADLKKLGIKVEVEIYEWSVFITKKIDVHDFDACVLGWSLGYDYDQYQLWHSSQSAPGGLNFCSYKNPEVDRLLELARSEFDEERAKAYCHELQRIIYDDQPYLFLHVPRGITAFHRETFRVRRPSAEGQWLDEPIRATKAGAGIYSEWWYRTAFGPAGSPQQVP